MKKKHIKILIFLKYKKKASSEFFKVYKEKIKDPFQNFLRSHGFKYFKVFPK